MLTLHGIYEGVMKNYRYLKFFQNVFIYLFSSRRGLVGSVLAY